MSVHPITILAVAAAISAGVYVNFVMPEPASHELPCKKPSIGDNPFCSPDVLAGAWPGCETLDIACLFRAEREANETLRLHRDALCWAWNDLAAQLSRKYAAANAQACECIAQSPGSIEACNATACLNVMLVGKVIQQAADQMIADYDSFRAQTQIDLNAEMSACCYEEVW